MEQTSKNAEGTAPSPDETTPMIGAQPPAVPVNYVQPAQTTVITAPCGFTEFPTQVTCPACHSTVVTRTAYTPGALTWILCLVICFFCGFLGCCLIPFCLDFCQDVVHSCPTCNTVVGRYKRL
ncbi:lipopolysaccharide-induced tumor necrosis factor-alpha factor homolog [Acanthaster planci]|uniref:Lipopolysaccharide-induced tumor necrosis factor-alpha factor homolog n=1 Tax=Acanthaster planci TaxID=133434 RepID=A0A8B7Y8L0_ACAPL|nr:lipopolysaccharide-induced tumor necrosis factor-alpha factor homolog [Acanthaster planci]